MAEVVPALAAPTQQIAAALQPTQWLVQWQRPSPGRDRRLRRQFGSVTIGVARPMLRRSCDRGRPSSRSGSCDRDVVTNASEVWPGDRSMSRWCAAPIIDRWRRPVDHRRLADRHRHVGRRWHHASVDGNVASTSGRSIHSDPRRTDRSARLGMAAAQPASPYQGIRRQRPARRAGLAD